MSIMVVPRAYDHLAVLDGHLVQSDALGHHGVVNPLHPHLVVSQGRLRRSRHCQGVSGLSASIAHGGHAQVTHLDEEQQDTDHIPLCTAEGEGVDRGGGTPISHCHLPVRQVRSNNLE